MYYKNLMMGLILLISVFSLACSAKIETEKYGSDTTKNEADSSSKKENGSQDIETEVSSKTIQFAKTGVYQLKNADTHNEFNIEEMNGKGLRIEFFGSYIYEVNGEEMANTGDAKGFASLKNNIAEFTPEEMEDCKMTLTFSVKTLKVTDNGKCIFGLNVWAPGTYKKISDKPVFEDEDGNVAKDSEQKKVRVKFAKGKSSATVKGRIQGFEYIDYIVGASRGQTLTAKLSSASQWAQFVVFDSNEENLEGSIGDTDFKTKLPQTGDYVIRVLMPRAEARRKGSMADYSLWIEIK